MSEIVTHVDSSLPPLAHAAFTRGQQFRLLIGAVLSIEIFFWASRLLHLPAFPGFSISLLQQPSAAGGMLVTGGLFIVCVILCSLLAGVRMDAGIFCAAIGLFALSARGGPMRYTLLAASSGKIYIALACELVALAGIVTLGRLVAGMLLTLGVLRRDSVSDGLEDVNEPFDQKLLGFVTGVVTMILIMLLLAQSDKKAQVMTAVAIASFFATLVSSAYFVAPTLSSAWFWSMPFVVGVIGYLGTYLLAPSGWEIGLPRGFLAPLARPLPIDYAAAGTVASILAYWLSRHWHHNHELEAAVSADSQP